MNDSEKLEIAVIYAELLKIQNDMNKLTERLRKAVGGVKDLPSLPKTEAAPASNNPQLGTSTHDSVGTVRTPDAAEIKAHTMEFNERITR